MIQSDLSYFAMHTNFDSAPGCMADLAAERIGICGGEPLEAMGEENGVLYGIGKTGSLETPVTGMELARRVKETFGLPFVTVYGEGLWEKELWYGGCLPGLWRQHHPGGPGKRGPSADHRGHRPPCRHRRGSPGTDDH